MRLSALDLGIIAVYLISVALFGFVALGVIFYKKMNLISGGVLDFKRDAVNVAVETIWQVGLTILPFYLVLMKWNYLAAAVALIAVTSLFLKKNWYDKLPAE